jgi:hypothetical protein
MSLRTLPPGEVTRPLPKRSGGLTLLMRHKRSIAVALALASTVLTLVMNPLGELKRRLFDVAPWTGVGVIVSETMFVGGIMMMAWAVGLRWNNPLKLRKALTEICRRANGSRIFWLGFWVNSLGAIGSPVIISIGLIFYLPPESYGLLSIIFADLAVTIVIRKAMLRGVKETTLRVRSGSQSETMSNSGAGSGDLSVNGTPGS